MSNQASALFDERLQGHLEPTIGGSVYIKPQDMEWRPSQFEGVEIKVLYENKEAGELTCLLRWAPGTTLPFHKHPELEQTWVLEGSFSDHEGICRAGEYVYRIPGSMHETHSAEGCTLLAIYRKPNIFRNSAGYDIENRKQVKTNRRPLHIRRVKQLEVNVSIPFGHPSVGPAHSSILDEVSFKKRDKGGG